jgi:hypothetical protein
MDTAKTIDLTCHNRPDLPQFKVMLSSLDPMGLPIATLVLSGKEADDGLYIPAVIRSRHGCGGRRISYLYVICMLGIPRLPIPEHSYRQVETIT